MENPGNVLDFRFQYPMIYLHSTPGLQDSREPWFQVPRRTCCCRVWPQEDIPDTSGGSARLLWLFPEANIPSCLHRHRLWYHRTASCASPLLRGGWSSHLSCLKCCSGHLPDRSSCTVSGCLRRLKLWQGGFRSGRSAYRSTPQKPQRQASDLWGAGCISACKRAPSHGKPARTQTVYYSRESPARKERCSPSPSLWGWLPENIFWCVHNSRASWNLSVCCIWHIRLHWYRCRALLPERIPKNDQDWKRYYLQDDIIDKPMYALTVQKLKDWAHKKIEDNHLNKRDYYNMAIVMKQCFPNMPMMRSI